MNLLKLILSFQLTVSAAPIFAGESADQARAMVKQSMQHAKNVSLNLISTDINSSMIKMMTALLDSPNVPAARDHILLLNQNLAQGFLQIANADENEIAKLESSVNEIYASYLTLVRRRFTDSFLVNRTIYQAEKVATQLIHVLEDFSNQCKMGRSDYSFDFNPALLPNLPPPTVDFYIQFGNSPDGNKFRSGSANSVDSKNLRDWNTASGISGGSAALAGNIAYGGAASTTVAGYASMAFPYLIVAFVAIAVITDFLAASEQAKLQTELTDANHHVFANSATDIHVANYYRDSCGSFSKLTTSLIPVLTSIQDRSSNNVKLLSEAALTVNKRKLWEEASVKRKVANGLLSLSHHYEANKCLTFEQLGADVTVKAPCIISTEKVPAKSADLSEDPGYTGEDTSDAKKDRTVGIVREETVALAIEATALSSNSEQPELEIIYLTANPQIKLPTKKAELKQIIAEQTSVLTKYSATYSDETVLTYVKHKIFEVMINTDKNIASDLGNIAWDELKRSQDVAFSKILQIFSLLRAIKLLERTGELDLVEEELAIQKNYLQLRGNFKKVIAKSLLLLRERITRTEYLTYAAKYIESARVFIFANYHLDLASEFERQIDKLEAINDAL